MSTRGGRPLGCSGHDNGGLCKRCPCPRRNWSKCNHPWYFNFAYDGQSYRFSLHKQFNKPRGYWMSKTEAEAIRDKVRAQIREGTFQSSGTTDVDNADTRFTFADVASRYLDEFKNDADRRPHRAVRLEMQLDLICRTDIPAAQGKTIRLGDKPIADFRTPDIDAFRDARRALMQAKKRAQQERAAKLAGGHVDAARALTVSTELPKSRDGEIGIKRHLEVIRHLFNWAIVKGHYDRENPFLRNGQRVIKMATEKPRSRRLQPGEEERLLEHSTNVPHLYALIIAAIETGCRKEELLSLQRKDIVFENRGKVLALQSRSVVAKDRGKPRFIMLRAENTKTDEPRRIPVSPRLQTILESRLVGPDGTEHGPDAFVFGNEVGERIDSIKTSWRTVCRKAGVEGLHFHDLRREHGSRLVEGGVNLLTVSKLLGHARVTTTDTYLNASELVAENELHAFHARQRRLARK
jgi:integrase